MNSPEGTHSEPLITVQEWVCFKIHHIESIFLRGHYINNTLSDVSFLFCHFMTGSIGYRQCNMICGGENGHPFKVPGGEAGKKK